MNKPLVRAMTFDDRIKKSNVSHGSNQDNDNVQFKKLTKKSFTFIDHTSTSTMNDLKIEKSNFMISDVIYRKHFGMNDDELKPLVLVNKPHSTPQTADSEGKDTIDKKLLSNSKNGVIVVDTFSTGALLVDTVYKMGYKVICVLSGDLKHLLDMVPEGLDYVFFDTFVYDDKLDDKHAALQMLISDIMGLGVPIEAVIAGAETGVELADQLSEAMNLRTNGTMFSEARRNKYVMGETVRAAGIRAVKQLRASTWGEISSWIEDWNPDPFKVIVKPVDSAGSDDVTLCTSMTDVQRAFGNIVGKVNGLGLVNRAVLVQEYLEGLEYVVDMVSRDGEHKVVGLWVYDRRAVNGAGFVCFGQYLLMPDEPHCLEIIEYQKKVITALGIRNGPTHGEVKWFKNEPVLVEVGARCHGGEGLWVRVANEAYGYNQVLCTIYSYLDEPAFNKLPLMPQKRFAHGRMKWLINYKDGIFSHVDSDALNTIKQLPTYRGHQIFLTPNQKVIKTQNCFSWGGCVRLVGKTMEEVVHAYNLIEDLEKGPLFQVKESETSLNTVFSTLSVQSNVITKPVVVAIVDPFSTGALLASDCYKLGYKIIACYSSKLEQLSNLQNLVPQGIVLSFESVIPFNSDISVMVKEINEAAKEVGSSSSESMIFVEAVMAGAETGVELADQLSEAMNLRTNGTMFSEARRNKYVMGETVRAAGIRAVKQLRASTWGEISSWIEDWNPDPFKVIVKPVDSAGSDGVTLCNNLTEVRTTFEKLVGSQNGLGLVNRAVLVQEYLDGQEYVVDVVSRDGEHKVVALWAYDRRVANGAGFVCFGQRLLTIDDPHCHEIVEYQKKVITALGIKNGPTHGEVKWFQNEPVLVEVGARCHGAEGCWQMVSRNVYGYDQVQATIDAYLHPEQFAMIPPLPSVRHAYGRMLFLIVFESGIFEDIHQEYLHEIQSMGSFIGMEIFLHKDAMVKPTIDCFGFGGVVKLVNEDLNDLIVDYERIREMELNGLFIFQK